MRKTLVVILFLVTFVLIAQNLERINEQIEKKWIGTIILVDGQEVNCAFTYNPFLRGGMLIVKTDSITNVYPPEKIQSFSFFDYEANTLRRFYSLPSNAGQKNLHFFELVYQSSKISILGSLNVKNKSGSVNSNLYPMLLGFPGFIRYQSKLKAGDPSPASGTRVKSDPKLHLYDHRDGSISDLSKNQLLRLTQDKKEEVLTFIKQNRLSLSSKDLDEYIYLIGYYAKLTDSNN